MLFLAEFGANFIEKYLKTFRRFFTLKRHRRVIKGRGRRDSRFGRLPVTTGYHYFGFRVTGCHWSADFGLRVVTGFNCLPEFRTQVGYGLPLV